LPKKIKSATAYITAHGMYETQLINDKRVTHISLLDGQATITFAIPGIAKSRYDGF